MKVLVMGGTQFNGLALVRELARHGHDVTVLNRGKTPVELPRGVRRLFADRTAFSDAEATRLLAALDVVLTQPAAAEAQALLASAAAG